MPVVPRPCRLECDTTTHLMTLTESFMIKVTSLIWESANVYRRKQKLFIISSFTLNSFTVTQVCKLMSRWRDGWMDGQTDRWTDGRTNGWIVYKGYLVSSSTPSPQLVSEMCASLSHLSFRSDSSVLIFIAVTEPWPR